MSPRLVTRLDALENRQRCRKDGLHPRQRRGFAII
jgi:hypothetical protein